VPAEDLHETYVRLLKGADMRAAQRHAREHIDLDFEELLGYARSHEQRASKGAKADRAGLTRNRPEGG